MVLNIVNIKAQVTNNIRKEEFVKPKLEQF